MRGGEITTEIRRDNGIGSAHIRLKFPAILGKTLGTDNPAPKRSDTGDIIDYYGPCDESPTGKDQVAAQRLEEQHHWREHLSWG